MSKPFTPYAIIMAGGRGERFWPMSTTRRPKQLLSLVGGKTLLAQAVDRLEGLFPPERIFIITNADLVEATREAVPSLPPAQIIGEPMGRDTGAAVALGAALVKARDPRGVFCVLTADHIIGKEHIFRSTLEAALKLAAEESVLVTIGIPPTEPSSAYGYVETGTLHEVRNGHTFHHVKRFVEKPSVEVAQTYLDAGTFFWNSGMFAWSVETLLAAFVRFRPQLLAIPHHLVPVIGSDAFDHELLRVYEGLEKISIDYAIMEKSDNIIIARAEFTWDDVGSWTALRNHFPEDDAGNVFIGEVEQVDSSGNTVVSPDRLTALVGVEGLVVVQVEGITLVCAQDRAQDIKQIVRKLAAHPSRADLI